MSPKQNNKTAIEYKTTSNKFKMLYYSNLLRKLNFIGLH